MQDKLAPMQAAMESGNIDKVWQGIDALFQDNINDHAALLLTTALMEKTNKPALLYHIAQRLVALYPNSAAGWLNLGRACDLLWRIEEAEQAYAQALKHAESSRAKCLVYVNWSALLVQVGRFEEAIPYAELALEIDPESVKARHNLGVSLLATRNWVDGWKYYSASVGTNRRLRWSYNNEPIWDGSPGKSVVVYGEQGLGDEISAASMFPDAIAASGKIILDCDPRLVGLYKRSFPKASVYGTRTKKVLDWEEKDHQIDASISAMELGGLFRRSDASFPGTPYLVADPARVLMWKALFQDIRKPVIGIAWTGGIQETGSKFRKLGLEQLLPIFSAAPVHWVSLQYKDASKEIASFSYGIDLVQYPYATLTNDYDDTAALVAACDMVICMQTSVAHLAGALGKECWVFLPRTSQWRYGSEGATIPWYNSVRVMRQSKKGDWSGVIEDCASRLEKRYAKFRVAA